MSLRDEYTRERRRIQSYITRLKNQGHNVTFSLPDEPKRITPASVMRLKKITPEVIRRRRVEEDETPAIRRKAPDDPKKGGVRRGTGHGHANAGNLKPHPENLKRGRKGGKGNAQNLTPHPENLQRGRKGGKGKPQNLKPHPENLQRGGRKKGSKNKRPRKSAPRISAPQLETEVLPTMSDKTFERLARTIDQLRGTPLVNYKALDYFEDLISVMRNSYGDADVARAINQVGYPTASDFYTLRTSMMLVGKLLQSALNIADQLTDDQLINRAMAESREIMKAELYTQTGNVPDIIDWEIVLMNGEWYYVNPETGDTVLIPAEDAYDFFENLYDEHITENDYVEW